MIPDKHLPVHILAILLPGGPLLRLTGSSHILPKRIILEGRLSRRKLFPRGAISRSYHMSSVEFETPEFYNFPPFFTLQPVLATREKQLRLWCDMVLRWHQSRKEYVFVWREWPLWENSTIGRKLGNSGALAVVEELIRSGHAEWNDSAKSMVTLMWHSADEIAAKLFDYARKHDMIGNVFTVYELHQGDEVLGTEFFEMDEGLFRKALAVLERQGRAVIFKGATSDEDGVKFLV